MHDDVAATINEQPTLAGTRLCNAVKNNPCIYEPQVTGPRAKQALNAAWKAVAKECHDTPANCKFRWKTIRNAFARSYKKYGTESQYYLYTHLVFMIPHLEADKNDESITNNEDINRSRAEPEDNSERIENGLSDSDTKSAEESNKLCAEQVFRFKEDGPTDDAAHDDQRVDEPQKDINELHNMTNDHSMLVEIQEGNSMLGNLTETDDSQSALPEERSGRRLRDRKVPKRFIEVDFSPERHAEKRPKRVMQRRKSVGGMVLKEFASRQSLPDFPYSAVNESVPRRKPDFIPDIPPFCDTTVDDRNLYYHNDRHLDFKIYSDASVEAKPIMIHTSTETELRTTHTVSVATQYEDGPRNLDDEFLDTLKPQMSLMNLRQKVNFKRRVYQALMEVLDDGTNFPNDNEILEAATAVAADFKGSTSSELRLMRELVSLVQAAKTTLELGDKGNPISPDATVTATFDDPSPAITPRLPTPPLAPLQPIDRTETLEKHVSPPTVMRSVTPNQGFQRPTNSQNRPIATTTSGNPMGIPRHVIQKAVKVAGSAGSTILTHDGDKRRIYRIFPKNVPQTATTPTSMQSGTPASAANKTQAGTFFVTPPKPLPCKPLSSSAPFNSGSVSRTNVRVVPYVTPPPHRVGNTTTSIGMLPPNTNKSPAITNGISKPTTMSPPQKIVGPPQMRKIISRRYSICGPATTKSPAISVPPPIRTPMSNEKTAAILQQLQQQKLNLAKQQQAQFNRHPPPPPPPTLTPIATNQSSVSQITMSKPVSLNTSTSGANVVKTFFKPAINENSRPRIVVDPLGVFEPPLAPPPPPPQPAPAHPTNEPVVMNEAEPTQSQEAETSNKMPGLETAGTITADNFGSIFNKPIKMEIEE